MNRREGEFVGQGRLRLYWQAWAPETEPRAAVVIVHGYGEHGGRYGNLVDDLVPRGYAVYALDHRGHGRSEGQRGHVARFREFVTDLHAFRVRVAEEVRSKPIVLLGHSLGGLIAIHYALEYASGLACLVLSSPALGLVSPPSRFRAALARVLAIVWPRASFQGNVDPARLSRDPDVGRAYAADPLVHSAVSARFFVEFRKAIDEAHERAPEIRLPVLILQAADDRLVDAAAAEAFANRVASERRELHVYPNLFHEIFNETEKESVFADLRRWLEHCCVTGA